MWRDANAVVFGRKARLCCSRWRPVRVFSMGKPSNGCGSSAPRQPIMPTGSRPTLQVSILRARRRAHYPARPAPGSANAYLRKYSQSGTVLWTRQFASVNARSLALDTTGVYVAVIGPLVLKTDSGYLGK